MIPDTITLVYLKIFSSFLGPPPAKIFLFQSQISPYCHFFYLTIHLLSLLLEDSLFSLVVKHSSTLLCLFDGPSPLLKFTYLMQFLEINIFHLIHGAFNTALKVNILLWGQDMSPLVPSPVCKSWTSAYSDVSPKMTFMQIHVGRYQ